MKKLILIDGNALLHRAYHAIKPLMDSKGRVVNALFGFAKVLQKIIKDMKPDYMAVCWDRKEKTFRHEAYAEYKATREAKPQDLYDQIEMIKDLLSAYGIPSYDKVGYEADDLLGTIAEKQKNKVDKILITTGDKDALQLVDKKINVVAFVKGVSETIVYDVAEVWKKYGISPKQLIDLKALMGDPSDNIKGVRGIGQKGAEDLIKKFGSIENLYKKLDGSDVSERHKELLRAGKKDALQSLALVEIRRDTPGKYNLSDMKFGDYDADKVDKVFMEHGFTSLLHTVRNDKKTVEETNSLEAIKKLVKEIEKEKEIAFYIIEREEGLFGKELAELSLAFGGRFARILFGKLKPEGALFALKPILENEMIKKIGYDIKAQLHILSRYGIDLAGIYFDVMLAGYILNPGIRRYSLENLSVDYLKKEISKLAIFDILNLKNLFAERIVKEKLERIFFDIEMPLIKVLFKMEQAGVKVDKKKLGKLSNDLTQRLKKIDKDIYKLAGAEFNIDSPQQLKVVLYDKLGLKPESGRIKKGKTGLSTAASELEKLEGTHPIVDLISEHRELAKLKNTYIDTLPKQLDKEDRVHTTYNQTITSTGRLSSSGPNLQNIPIRSELGKEIRSAFIAEEGFTLASLDYSQIELRIAAAITGERHMIDAFSREEDVHRQTASEIFSMPPEKVTKDMRHKAKSINFGVLYGMGVKGLAKSLKIGQSEAWDFLDKYYASHPAIVDYMERTKALAYKQGYVETIFGRRRYLPEINSYIQQLRASAERMAINMPIQGTQADIIKMAMIEIDKNINPNEARMLLQVHDELVFEVKKGNSKVVEEIKEIMEQIYKLKIPLLVQVDIEERWR